LTVWINSRQVPDLIAEIEHLAASAMSAAPGWQSTVIFPAPSPVSEQFISPIHGANALPRCRRGGVAIPVERV
jgi:hypothetical protein